MPIITAHILAGRDVAKKAVFVRAATDATVQTLGVPIKSARVIINEIAPDHFGIAGETISEINARKQQEK